MLFLTKPLSAITLMIMHKKIKSKGSIIKYEPLSKQWSIISGELFHFNNDSHQFELDLNPYGDPEPVPISDLRNQKDKLTFNIVLNSEREDYTICSKYKSDQIIYQMMIDLNQKFQYKLNEIDKFYVEFEKSTLKRIELIRYNNIKIDKSLIIVFDKEGDFVIKYPFEKLILQSIDIDETSIICRTPDELIKWEPNIQPLIFGYIRKIITVGLDNQLITKRDNA